MKVILIISMAMVNQPPMIQIPMDDYVACLNQAKQVYVNNQSQNIKFIATCVNTGVPDEKK